MDREKRALLVFKILNEGDQSQAEKTIKTLKDHIGDVDVYDYMMNKYNSMSLEVLEDHIRVSYEEDGKSSLDPKIDKMIKAGIKELADG